MWKDLFDRLLGLLTWLVMVPPWEQALRVRRGKNVKLLGAGMHLRIPGLDQVYRQPIRRRRCVLPPQVLTTSDGRSVTLGAALGYAISDLLTLYSRVHDAQDTIETDVAGDLADYVTTHTLDECSPQKLITAVQTPLARRLGQFGLTQVDVRICSFVVAPTIRVISGNLNEGQAEWLSTNREEGSE